MREDQALQAVLETLRGLIRQCISPETLVSACGQSGRAEDDPSVRRQRLEQRLATARRARLNAYKDQAAGKLSAEEFAYIAAELEREEANCRETLDVLCAAPPPDPARSARGPGAPFSSGLKVWKKASCKRLSGVWRLMPANASRSPSHSRIPGGKAGGTAGARRSNLQGETAGKPGYPLALTGRVRWNWPAVRLVKAARSATCR